MLHSVARKCCLIVTFLAICPKRLVHSQECWGINWWRKVNTSNKLGKGASYSRTTLPMPELLTVSLLQKRLEENLCWIIPRVPMTTQPVKGLNWTELSRYSTAHHLITPHPPPKHTHTHIHTQRLVNHSLTMSSKKNQALLTVSSREDPLDTTHCKASSSWTSWNNRAKYHQASHAGYNSTYSNQSR